MTLRAAGVHPFIISEEEVTEEMQEFDVTEEDAEVRFR